MCFELAGWRQRIVRAGLDPVIPRQVEAQASPRTSSALTDRHHEQTKPSSLSSNFRSGSGRQSWPWACRRPRRSGFLRQDWIRTLGKDIVNVHLKDFKRKEDGYAWVNLGDGDVDWPAVRQAFAEIGYSGSAIVELAGGDEACLRDVSRRIDRLLLGRP